jgi:hypothetical protein
MVITLPVKKLSKWQFDTSATGGLGIGLFSASGGLVQLKTKARDLVATYHYGGAGAGWSWGGKLPKIPKLPKIDLKGKSAAGSSTTFDSYGEVFVMQGCKKDELSAHDLSGPCMFVDAGAGLIGGFSGTVLLAGISTLRLIAFVASPMDPMAFADLMYSAQGVILMGGWNVGAQAGFGASVSLGYLYLNYVRDPDQINIAPDANEANITPH